MNQESLSEEQKTQNIAGDTQQKVFVDTHIDPPYVANPVLVTRISGGILNDVKLLHLLFFSGAKLPVDIQGEAHTILTNLVASVLITPGQAEFLKQVLEEYLKDAGHTKPSED
uniref:Uncharacterized protein n=1 Tax=Thermus caliditerrae TaxID=1330700 RepID=A0A7C5REE3_9DEIN